VASELVDTGRVIRLVVAVPLERSCPVWVVIALIGAHLLLI